MRLVRLVAPALVAFLVLPGAASAADSAPAASTACHRVDSAARVTSWADGRFGPAQGADVRLSTPAAGHYVPAGTAPSVTASVDPAGAALAGHWSINYVVADRDGPGRTTRVELSSDTDTALTLPPAVPGLYEVGAQLLHNGAAVASTCLHYAVGMPGNTLDFAALPPGGDWGGGSGERAAALYSQLGIAIPRLGADFGKLVQDVGFYDAAPGYVGGSWPAAAAMARRTGAVLDVQIGQGGAAEKRAVADGSWERIVRATVAHYPSVQHWEAWNEPDWTFGGSATDYVNRVLKPFARAVHSANPSASVVGGSAVGFDHQWWAEFARAGGFRAVDAVGIHPYTSGFAASWEQDDVPGDIHWLQGLKDSSGGRGKPLWDTESAWPSKGPTSMWQQADYLARKLIWERALGVVSGEFLAEGGWDDWAIVNQIDGIHPAGLGAAAQRTILAGSRFAGWQVTGNAHVFAARFNGPRGAVTAVWSDGARSTVRLKTPMTGYDELGAPIRLSGAVSVTGAVRYLVGGAPAWADARRR